jgi:hypothetical protein
MAAVRRFAEQQGLCILALDGAALTVDGKSAGRLDLPGAPTSDVAVAPDGACVAWTDRRSVPYTTEAGEPVIFLVEDYPRSPRALRFDGGFAAGLAVSSKAGRVALIAAKSGGTERRLIVLSPATGRIEHDVTALITRFGLDEVQTLRMSGNGGRLVVGSREAFCVIDLRTRTLIYQGAGRFPRISPQGETLAFVDGKEALWVAKLAGGDPRRLMRGWAVPGVGAWSPDGRFLLAGARTSYYYFDELVVIDCANDSFAAIASLGEGNQGPLCTWVKRTLLT